MNLRIETLSLALASALPLSFTGVGQAASLTYDANPGASGAQDGSGLGWNATAVNLWNGSADVLWPNTTADEIVFGAGNGAAGPVTVDAVTANRISFAAPGSGSYTLTGGTITLGGTAPAIAVNSDATIASALAGAAGLTTSGTGALTLTGMQTYNGPVTLANRSVTFSGTAASATTNDAVLIGGANGRTLVRFDSTGNFTYGTTAGNTRIGGNDGAGDTGAGAVRQTAGNVTFSRNVNYLELGTNGGATPTSYGSYLLSGGAFATTVNGGMRVGNGGVGVFTQTGGTANIGRWLAIGTSTGAAVTSTGIVTLTGGSLTVNGGFRALLGDRQNASGTLNLGTMAGGDAVMTHSNTGGVVLLSAANALNATVNLNSGTLILGGPINRNGTNAGSSATVNLNGGTLRPGTNNTNLLSGDNGLVTRLYNGGLKVDTQALDATLSASLTAATGNGLYPAGGVLPLPAPAGAGYLGAPAITVTSSGTGTGASAVATLTDGQVTGVALTCPGQGYQAGDTVTFTFAGGGAATAAAPFVHTLTAGEVAANGAGGLTKLGTGTLNLTGANTLTTPLSITGTLVAKDLTLENTTLSVHGFSPEGLAAPIQVNDHFATGGAVQVAVEGTFGPGSWPLIFYPVGGSIGGSGVAALQLQTGLLPRGVVATLVDNPGNSSVDLKVTEFNPLTWKGNASSTWDIDTTANWTIGSSSEKYLDQDLVLFNDNNAAGNPTVTLNTTVVPRSVTFDNGIKNYTLTGTGSISGTGGLTKSNDGTVTLLTANTYTGDTVVNGGTLQLGDGSANGTITGPLVNNATVVFNPAGVSPALASDLEGDSIGIFVKTGPGTQVLVSTVNTSAGIFRVQEGVLQFGNGTVNGTPGLAPYEIAAGASLRFEHATGIHLPWENFSGAGTVLLNSAQAVNATAFWDTFNLTSNFTGVVRVEKGRINANAGSDVLGGTSRLEILPGAQFLGFTSANPYTTPIEIAGTGWGEGGYPGGLRLAAASTATWQGSVTLTADSGIMAQRGASFTVTGPITGAYQCEFYVGDPAGDSGTLTIAPATPGQNTYAATRINGRPNGSIVAGSEQAFSSGPLTVANAILKLNGHDLAFANLSGTGGAIGNYHATTPATLTVGADSSSTTYAGVLRDGDAAPLALVKTGSGKLALSGASTYTGDTTVAQGTLALTQPYLANGSTVTLASGAVLELDTGSSDTVAALVLGGVSMPDGTYGASHPVYGSYFAGTGTLSVGVSAYDAWAAAMGLDGTPGKENGLNDDPDRDGISNLTEFYLDGDPLANDPAILPAGSLDATSFTLTFHRRDDAEAEVTGQLLQYGSTLVTWTDVVLGAVGATDGNGVILTIAENGASPDTITVRIPRTLAVGGKLFGRLQVTK